MKVQFDNSMICVQDIIYYDGPAISHYKSQTSDYIFSWMDDDEQGHYLWLAIKVDKEHLNLYLSNQISLLDLQKTSQNMYICREECVDSHNEAWGEPVSFDALSDHWKAKEDSYLGPFATQDIK